ncbi:outer membrane protein assembly factor BamD [Trichlorobacter lovleyi]|uniref:outer membrane protein assembly factor BamD n=1 Tax=Trichlorobacter lovleyi TaxID=313985 RepID=UPI00223FFDA1|nr:outer membrane protein assembly factor BamD [Trichlorobacter lovleyi]QOX78157.1 outer membrane protein assembly factor BamD [Trichlorobacter lovleyi]
MRYSFSHCQPLRFLVCLFLLFCLLAPAPLKAEIDDSSLFMEAFTAFQGKDYLHSIDKLHQMDQLFPDSPLRDVSLLMLARAQYRSGDNDSAAQTLLKFNKEFGSGPLADSIEADLSALSKRRQAGEKLPPNKQLRAAAQKVRNEQLALERAAALKAEQARLAQERAERERIAREKAEADRKERERLAALKAAREAVKFELESPAAPVQEVGSAALVAFQLINHGKDAEEFSLEALLPSGVEGMITQAADRTQPVQKITLQPRQRAELLIAFKMPSDRVDGSRITATAKATSTKFNDISRSKELTITAAAPLLRAVSRLQQTAFVAGEAASYKVTLLNVGSKAAKEIDLRISLPQQLKLTDAGGNGCWIENEQLAACRIDAVASGSLTERSLKVMVRADAAGKTAKGAVEVLQTALQVKESFPGAAFTVKAKQP